MKSLRQFAFGSFAVAFIAASAVMSFADADPPSRVARLKYISGEVSMQPGGVNDWTAATINRPMTTADRLWTDKDARAELHLGSAAMRMDSETSLTLSNLTDNTVQMELDQGTLDVQVMRLSRGEIYEVDTPNTAFTLLKPGNYRFDVDSQGDGTLITVWNGRGVATGSGQAVRIDGRRQVRFMGGMSMAHAEYGAPRLDGFDEWCQTRANLEARSISRFYVSPDVVGYEDLDAYGSWRPVPSYGMIWFPTRVEAGWAPYRDGHWIWMDPWGWTWVDDEPWGFAPFHYGRWVSVAGSWAWAPGPAYVRPCYAPALVAWVGSSGAGVGWFPLGYGEPYIPSYHVSRGYFQTINVSNTRITNITYVTNTYYNTTNVRINNIHYVNQTTAITIVNNDVLVNSRRVDRDAWMDHDHDRDRRDDRERWVMAGPPVPPSHESVLGSHDRPAALPPERIGPRRVVVNVKPPDPPSSFEARHPEARGHDDRPMDSRNDDRYRQHMPDDRRPDNSGYGNREAQAGPDRHDDGRGWHGQPDDHRSGNQQPDGRRWDNQPDGRRSDNRQPDDRDRRNAVGDEARDYPHPPRRGDDNRGQQWGDGRNEGNQQDQRQAGQNQNGNNGNHGNGGDNGNDRNNGNGGDRRAEDGGNPHNPGSRWEQPQNNDSAGRQFPHPPQHGDDRGQPSSNANAGGGNQNAGNSGSGNYPDPRQQGHNPNGNNGNNGNDGQSQGNNGGNGRNAGNPPLQGQNNDASNGRQFPHPPQRGDDRGQPASNPGNPNAGNSPDPRRQGHNGNGQGNSNAGNSGAGNYPAPRQEGQSPDMNPGQSHANYGGNGQNAANPPSQGNDASAMRPVPRPEYQPRPTPVYQPQASPQPAPVQQPERQMPQASYGGRAPMPAAAQQQPQQQAAHNDARPAAPAPRMTEPQRAPQAQSRPAPAANTGGNPHAGSALQENNKGKVQDR